MRQPVAEGPDLVPAVLQVAGRDTDVRTRRGHPIERGGVRILECVIVRGPREQVGIARARSVALDVRQGSAEAGPFVRCGKPPAKLTRESGGQVVAADPIGRAGVEARLLTVASEGHGPAGTCPLQVVVPIEPQSIANDRPAKLEDPVGVLEIVNGSRHVLGFLLVGRFQLQRGTNGSLQGIRV